MATPRPYNDLDANEILRRMASGETITAICKDEAMPSLTTVWEWQKASGDFAENYARARKMQAHAWANEQIDLADAPLIGRKTITETDPAGLVTVKEYVADNVERTRLMIDARRWAAARSNPEAWGDRLAHQMLDEKGQPARLEITVSRVERKKG